MADVSVTGVTGPLTAGRAAPRDPGRSLRLLLAAAWVLDAVLQAQPFMFSRAFASQALAGSAAGNPAWVAHSVAWAAAIVAHHPALANTAFAAVQLLLGAGIAWRPALRPALAASVAWAVAVWWFGEGFGGVLTAAASPVTGAPGAAVLYALLAVMLWPAERRPAVPFIAARLAGAAAARLAWLLLWGSLAYFAVSPVSLAPQGLHDTITGLAAGEPRWLGAVLGLTAAAVAHRGAAVSIVLAVLLSVVAAGVFLPPRAARATLVLAVFMAAAMWVGGQALGGIFTGEGTDPNSGPLLALLAAAYWPRPAGGTPAGQPAPCRGEVRAAAGTFGTARAEGGRGILKVACFACGQGGCRR